MRIGSFTHGALVVAIGLGIHGLVFGQSKKESKLKGSVEAGYWFVQNNVSGFSDANTGVSYTAQDGYGNAYVQDNYMLFHARLKLKSGNENKDTVGFKFQGRTLINYKPQAYSLGPNDQFRATLKDFYGFYRFGDGVGTLFFGRKTNHHVGGISVDGITLKFNPTEALNIGLYGGLGVDPRQFTGYIGPQYQLNPINPKYFTAGIFGGFRNNTFSIDGAINSLLYDFKMDRLNFYTQLMAKINEVWRVSGLADIGLSGDPGLVQTQLYIHTHITPKISNQLGFHRYRSIYFAESDASGIPVPASINPAFDLGTQVNTSYYNTFSNHTKFALENNYFFTHIRFSKRTFDELKRTSFVIGYRDPNIQRSGVSTTIKTALIDNYKSFHAWIDMMLGIDILPRTLNLALGGRAGFHQREVFQGFQPLPGQTVNDPESTLRANLTYRPSLKTGIYIQYRLHNQTDAVNLNQKVILHEVFMNTNIRF